MNYTYASSVSMKARDAIWKPAEPRERESADLIRGGGPSFRERLDRAGDRHQLQTLHRRDSRSSPDDLRHARRERAEYRDEVREPGAGRTERDRWSRGSDDHAVGRSNRKDQATAVQERRDRDKDEVAIHDTKNTKSTDDLRDTKIASDDSNRNQGQSHKEGPPSDDLQQPNHAAEPDAAEEGAVADTAVSALTDAAAAPASAAAAVAATLAAAAPSASTVASTDGQPAAALQPAGVSTDASAASAATAPAVDEAASTAGDGAHAAARIPGKLQAAADGAVSANGLFRVAPAATDHLERLASLPPANVAIVAAASQQAAALTDALTAGASDDPLQPLVPFQVSDEYQNPVPIHTLLQGAHPSANSLSAAGKAVEVPAGTFAKDVGEYLLKSFDWKRGLDGATEVKFALNPGMLGHVKVELTLHNGQLTAHFTTNSMLGKELLEDQLLQLRTTLQSQGIQVERMEVSQNSLAFQSQFSQERQQRQQAFNGAQEEGSTKDSGNSYTDAIEGANDDAAADSAARRTLLPSDSRIDYSV